MTIPKPLLLFTFLVTTKGFHLITTLHSIQKQESNRTTLFGPVYNRTNRWLTWVQEIDIRFSLGMISPIPDQEIQFSHQLWGVDNNFLSFSPRCTSEGGNDLPYWRKKDRRNSKTQKPFSSQRVPTKCVGGNQYTVVFSVPRRSLE